MNIRPAKLGDLKGLAALMKEVISNTSYYTKEAKNEESRKHNVTFFKQYLKDKKYYSIFIAEEGKKITGFVIGRNEAGVLWLDWIGVHKDARGKGIALSLMKEIEVSIKKKGVHKIWCDTRTTNKESVSLLNKLKYRKLGVFKNGWYKQDFFLWEKDIK